MKILDAEKVHFLSIKVSEEILKKNLHNFIKTNITNSGFPFSKYTFFSFIYNHTTQTYEILFYEKKDASIIIEPLIYLHNKKLQKTLVYVFYTQSYFTIIENNKLKIFQRLDNINKDDIEIFIKQIYKIKKFEMTFVDNNKIQELKQTLSSSKKHTFDYEEYPLETQKSFYYFLFFLAISSSIFLLFFSPKYFNEIPPLQNKIIKTPVIKKIPKKKPIDKIMELSKYISINELHVKNISYEKNTLKTILLHRKKQKILDFLNVYKKKIIIQSFKYDDSKKIYSLEVSIEI